MGYLGPVEEAGPPIAKEQIFVSYGRRDGTEAAEELCAILEDHGYRVWLDKRAIPAGSVFPARIQAGIEGSDLLVAILTPWSVRHESWCLDELVHARNTEVPILPVRYVEGLIPPFPVARFNAIDAFGDREGSLREVLAQVETVLRTGRSPLQEFGADPPWWTRVERLDFDADLGRDVGKFVGREWLFDLLRERIRETDTRVILLTGAAGIGKTAIAAQASVRLNVRGVHFCQRSMPRSCRPESWLAGLVHQLALQFPAYREQLESMPEPEWQDTRGLFRRIVATPLAKAAPSLDISDPLVFVVDGLDEAVALEGHSMSRAIRDAVADFPPWLRVIVTSRPDHALRDSFKLPHVRVDEIEADIEPNLADVRAYVESRIGQLADVSDDPGRRVALVRWIVEAVEGNFLVASMTLDELAERGLDAFKGPDTEALFPRDAKGLYTQMFENRFDRKEYRDQLRPLLEALVAARSPLPDGLLCGTVESRYDAVDGIAALSQFLQTGDDGHVLFHKSLADWLVRYARGTPYVVIAEHGHRKLAELCESEYAAGVERMSPYALRHLPAHLMLAGDWATAIQVLDDPGYRQTKIDQGHYDELIADLEMAQRDQPATLTPAQRSILSALWTKVPDRDEDEPAALEKRPGADDALKKLVALLGQGTRPKNPTATAGTDPEKLPGGPPDSVLAMLEALSKAGHEGGRTQPVRPTPRDLEADNELLLSHLRVKGITLDKLAKAIVTPPGETPPDLEDPNVLQGVLRAVIAKHFPDLDADEILRTRRQPVDQLKRFAEARAKVESVQARLEEKAQQGDLVGARRIVEELAEFPELAEVRDAWTRQIDEAERAAGGTRLVEEVVERVKLAMEKGDFAGARTAVDEMPGDRGEVRAFRRSIHKQIDEAEHAARIRRRLEETIERVKALTKQGRLEEARAEIRSLPDDPEKMFELKLSLLSQLEAPLAMRGDREPGHSAPGGVDQATAATLRGSLLRETVGSDIDRRWGFRCPRCGAGVGQRAGQRILGVLLGALLTVPPMWLVQRSWWWLLLVVPLALVGIGHLLRSLSNWSVCVQCRWSGVPRGRDDAARSRTDAPRDWTQSPELAAAAEAIGLRGAAFSLKRVDVAWNVLTLTFGATADQAHDKAEDAGKALLCVVGLTLPAAIRHSPGLYYDAEVDRRVDLSDGVALSSPRLRGGGYDTGYLTLSSEIDGRSWRIKIAPAHQPERGKSEAQTAALRLLLPFFESRREVPVVLG